MPESAKKKKKAESETSVIQKDLFHFASGDTYDGEYILNENGVRIRQGQGQLVTKTGIIYDGSWKNDNMNGQGHIEFPSGIVYDGDFVDNQFHGEGTMRWPNGCFYTGPFKENRLDGEGKFTDTEGQIWTGQFLVRYAPALKFNIKLT